MFTTCEVHKIKCRSVPIFSTHLTSYCNAFLQFQYVWQSLDVQHTHNVFCTGLTVHGCIHKWTTRTEYLHYGEPLMSTQIFYCHLGTQTCSCLMHSSKGIWKHSLQDSSLKNICLCPKKIKTMSLCLHKSYMYGELFAKSTFICEYRQTNTQLAVKYFG